MFTGRSTARGLPPASLSAAAGVCALALLAACGGDAPEATPGAGTSAPAPAPSVQPTTDFNDADVAFARMMIPLDEQAVEMARLAAARASDPGLAELAAEAARVRSSEIAAMTGWLAAWGKAASGEGPGQDVPGLATGAEMAGLRRAEGAEFDRRFAELMIGQHRGAVEMAAAERAEGLNPAARRLAETVGTSRQAESERLEKILGGG
ncbi:hypothetical protein Ppa06_43590 [Planomonospora parontospora subsp. parontospora]|uniref:DUF305 domain-containing protein n=2 Tax=Planomonospora parontospora TaxID=58119 RepID=A0AA37BKD1_9ACTN|nr:DUF305 domain-containing protein [Planomonospora parontospora]GGK84294.1 hypothetical protein GCM10010126_49440 [Planomonospora parontospora]GII10561.1 hypothetical protein Ppa06_43590 [Planomonospora parontospora subsp. parontospora]